MSQIVPAGLLEELVAIRRDLHQHPEPSWEEHRTSSTLMIKKQSLEHLRAPLTKLVEEA